jgi:hypothetical protein
MVMALVEIMPASCPNGREAWQRPSCDGCRERDHRTYTCEQCHVHHADPDCPCQR